MLGQTNPEFNPDYDGNGFIGVDDILGVLGYFDTTWEDPQFSCGDPMSYQGYDYATVLIGDQCWFAENLRSENYENGEEIATNAGAFWPEMPFGGQAIYGTEGTTCGTNGTSFNACNDPVISLNTYGRLYNWYAVHDLRGLCPSGWHVPTNTEWTVMANGLGGASVAGGHLKTDYGWFDGGNGTNSVGFSGLPGGWRDIINEGAFLYEGANGIFWSSTNTQTLGGETVGVARVLSFEDDAFYEDAFFIGYGMSVRCIQD